MAVAAPAGRTIDRLGVVIMNVLLLFHPCDELFNLESDEES